MNYVELKDTQYKRNKEHKTGGVDRRINFWAYL